MTLLKENENLKYDDDDFVSCIEFFSIRGVEIDDVKLHDQFCNLISFLKSKSDVDEAYNDLKLHEQSTSKVLKTLNVSQKCSRSVSFIFV